MTRDTLNKAVDAAREETRAALQTVYDALNKGQQQKLLKNETVADLFDLYDVNTE